MDLVSEAGVDITDWANYKGGKARAAANPKYCYEWSFENPGQLYVLNLWFDHMEQDGDEIFQEINFRPIILEYERNKSKKVWARRARKLDKALQNAFNNHIPLRIVVCEGQLNDIATDDSEASSVSKRLLDPVPWAVTEYDMLSGIGRLVRGGSYKRFLDQFDLLEANDSLERRETTGNTFVRSHAVRQAVLARAAGKCEHCGKAGFEMANGDVYLETHHLVALSEGGPDKTSNVFALCPNHHREAHYGRDASGIRNNLLEKI